MKSPSDSILTAIYNLLNGRLSYMGFDYPVYVTPKGDYNFVTIGDLQILDDSTDTAWGTECALVVDVITKGNSWKPANAIESQVLDILIDRDILMPDFKIVVPPRLDNIIPFIELRETETIYRKAIRIIFNIKENG